MAELTQGLRWKPPSWPTYVSVHKITQKLVLMRLQSNILESIPFHYFRATGSQKFLAGPGKLDVAWKPRIIFQIPSDQTYWVEESPNFFSKISPIFLYFWNSSKYMHEKSGRPTIFDQNTTLLQGLTEHYCPEPRPSYSPPYPVGAVGSAAQVSSVL